MTDLATALSDEIERFQPPPSGRGLSQKEKDLAGTISALCEAPAFDAITNERRAAVFRLLAERAEACAAEAAESAARDTRRGRLRRGQCTSMICSKLSAI